VSLSDGACTLRARLRPNRVLGWEPTASWQAKPTLPGLSAVARPTFADAAAHHVLRRGLGRELPAGRDWLEPKSDSGATK
jgi:hypothetical protein